MITEDVEKHVETLIERAAQAYDSGDAMRYSQAACNAANALGAVKSVRAATEK